MPADDVDAIGVSLSELSLHRPRQCSACWLALDLWQQLELDSYWRARLRPSREGTPWLKVLKTLAAYRLIDPGSEWRLHRQWFDASAMADLLQADFALAEKNTLYRCLDKLVHHKDELFKFLKRRWGELFGASFEVLLYDLTSTYFETDVEHGPQELRKFGYSRDKRGGCRQVVVALIVTPEGLPLSYEELAGNTADSNTLADFLDRIEQRYGKARRIWVMDRGIPTEDSLAKMRHIGAFYLVGTPKGRLSKLEQDFLAQPWAKVREGVQVKRLATQEDVYVLAQSDSRIDKERGMRRKRLRRYVDRLQALQGLHAHARSAADEARGGAAGGRACGRTGQGDGTEERGQDGEPAVQARSRQAAPGTRSRGALLATLQSHHRCARAAVELLHPAHRGGASVQGAQARSGGASDLPPNRRARPGQERHAHVHRP